MTKIEFDAEKHRYYVDGKRVPSVSDILSPITADHYGGINPAVLQAAASRGTMVHEQLEAIDYDFFDGLVPYEIKGYCKAYMDFLRDYDVDWYGIEEIVYNADGGYCGTVDRWGKIDGEWAVLDIKTYAQPTKENYMSLLAQTDAYLWALIDEDKIKILHSKVKRYGLFLRKDGTYRLVDCTEYEEKFGVTSREIFDKCLDLYQFKERILQSGKRKRNSSI